MMIIKLEIESWQNLDPGSTKLTLSLLGLQVCIFYFAEESKNVCV